MNNVNMFVNVITSPTEAFNALKEKPHFLLPFILIPLVVVAFQLIYFNVVDYTWMLEQMALQAQMNDADPAQIESIKNIPKMLMLIPGIISAVLVIVLVQLIYASYLMLVSKASGDNFGFKAMFSLSWWCAIPAAFTMVACIVNVLLADGGRIYADAVNPFSLNSLIFDFGFDSPFRSILANIDLFMFWSWALLTIAYKQFSGRSYVHSALVVLAPYAVIYGIWILFAAL